MLFNINTISTEKYKPKKDDLKMKTIEEETETFMKTITESISNDPECKKYKIKSLYITSGKYVKSPFADEPDDNCSISDMINNIKKSLVANTKVYGGMTFVYVDSNINKIPKEELPDLFNHMLDLSHAVLRQHKLHSLTIDTDGDKYDEFEMILVPFSKGKKLK